MIDARTHEPKISVVMSVYNASRHIAKAIDSILAQSLTDFEFIIVNDGSTDDSKEIIKGYEDPRIRYFEHKNIGPAASRNRGIMHGRGKYVAIMDADDIALPKRLAEQAAVLDRHPHYGFIGSYCYLIDESDNEKSLIKHPRNDVGIRWLNLFDSPFVHSSVLLYREAVESVDLYDAAGYAEFCEDYDLWSRLLSQFTAANFPKPLMLYRDNLLGISRTRRLDQEQRSISISARNIAQLLGDDGFGITRAQRIRYLRIGKWSDPHAQEVEAALRDLRRIETAFAARHKRQLELHPSVKVRIRNDLSRSLLSAAYFMGACADRKLALRLTILALRKQPSSAFRARFWRTIANLALGSGPYSVIRSLYHRLR